MKKIPTIFARNFDGNPSLVTRKQVVFIDGSTPTRKYDGTSFMVDEESSLFKRRTVKKDKAPPVDFIQVDKDETTGKLFGWVPVDPNKDKIYFKDMQPPEKPGTYEFCGPKVNGNNDNFGRHVYIEHGIDKLYLYPEDGPGLYDFLKAYLKREKIEGIVFWKLGKPIGKIKRTDFGLAWPVKR